MTLHRKLLLTAVAAILASFLPAAQGRPLNVFLYVEDYEVRQEILAPLTVVEALFPVERTEPGVLTIADQDRVADDLSTYFSLLGTLRIDGILVAPDGEDVVFFDRDIEEITGDYPRRDIAADRCLVGIILRYPTMGPPDSVSIEWTGFNPAVSNLRLTAFPYEDSLRAYLSPSSPEFSWRAPGSRDPFTITPLDAHEREKDWLGRRRPLEKDEATEIARVLLRNAYRAFHYRREERIYDALERTVGGSLLADVYLSIRAGLQTGEEGSAIIRIDEVSLEGLEAEELGPESFTADVRWTVRGRIEHWGHVHERLNLYEARIGAAVREGRWLLTTLNVTNSRRLEARLVTREVTQPADREE